jgi:hypothetical protein
MPIIDTHIHMHRHAGFDSLCEKSRHLNSLSHVMQSFAELDIRACVVMGSGRHADENPTAPGLFNLGGEVDLARYNYPKNVTFCVGVNPAGLAPECLDQTLRNYEQALLCPQCAGFKFYLGYQHIYADDPVYHPVYELAARKNATVVFHTGDTANSRGKLRFSHPLTVDDVAVRYPQLRIVMAHFGNPWITDAAEVAKKNPNVYVDLSGLAVGVPDTEEFRRRYAGYAAHLETWIAYLDKFDRILYGTDWPLVNMAAYVALIRTFIPKEEWPRVFYQNALEAFPVLAPLV